MSNASSDKIDMDMILEECSKIPPMLALQTASLSKASQLLAEAELCFELLEAQIEQDVRNATEFSDKKVTLESVRLAIKRDQRWLEAKKDILEKEMNRNCAKDNVTLVLVRKELLIALLGSSLSRK